MTDLLWWLGEQYMALCLGTGIGLLIGGILNASAQRDAYEARVWRVDEQP